MAEKMASDTDLSMLPSRDASWEIRSEIRDASPLRAPVIALARLLRADEIAPAMLPSAEVIPLMADDIIEARPLIAEEIALTIELTAEFMGAGDGLYSADDRREERGDHGGQ